MTSAPTALLEMSKLPMVPRVLVIEDERAVQIALRQLFECEGYSVEIADCGMQCLELLHANPPTAIILNVQLPDISGQEVLWRIQRLAPSTPIIVLSAKSSVAEKVFFLDLGADDYVTKPFHMRELTARVRAAIRRAQTKDAPPENVLQIGAITLDPGRRVVSKAGHPVHLTPKEFDLLHYLMLNAGKPIAHNRLLTAVWGPDYGGELEYLRTFVRQLRKKLEDDPSHPSYLMTEMWFGYRFQGDS